MYTRKQIGEAENYLQAIMDEAYDMWRTKNEWRKEQFWLHLTYPQKVTVWSGNLNYQIHNGGFLQWHDNGYSNCAEDLILILEEINTDATMAVANIIRQVMNIVPLALDEWNGDYYSGNEIALDELDELDSKFYDIAEIFMVDVAEYLKGLN